MHVRRPARDALFPSRDDDVFFAPRRGDVVLRDGASVRAFAARINERDGRAPQDELRPDELAAFVLLHDIFHAVLGIYRERHPESFRRFASAAAHALGSEQRRRVAVDFLGAFPPPVVYRTLRGEGGDDTPSRYLDRQGLDGTGESDEELLLLWVTNQNPAYDPVRAIVSDRELGSGYVEFIAVARGFFDGEPRFGPGGESLVELLLAPSKTHPKSIFAQLDYVERTWGSALGLDRLPLWRRLSWVRDVRNEEAKWFERRRGPGPGEPLLEAMRFGRRTDGEPANFSPDLGWMPNVVLVAKSVYVWLDQLSRKYERDIWCLHHIPDEELDELAARGMNGLWLIGLFERSSASRKIKQLCGDRDALASAYSLKRYEIARELGGEAAYEDLKARAWARGIRLAADMVPNHVGLDGDWVIEHPDWFLQTRTPPFPNYRFGGPDLSDDPRVGIFLEEGYWHKTDAAVVFRRHDRQTGEDRFVYHGNDGTNMPWNDTAQLDYLKEEVRRAVIETILDVARRFPIIRFDAAMTLAKRHIQRLWYPLPGEGGAVPSRADYALTEEQFERLIPVEFWREVVDVVAERAPDTLLLAEAFWMMEGYFVRTLGMHRVYNSAFMNMLKREENAKYRATIKNVLDFDSEILKRFVNFMNNPDEETAAVQFGDGDKYFGTCVLMSTLPGLPMFGHGQVEGLREKYGMEYRRARSDEPPNEHLIRRHEREIFPLLHKRYLFSGVERFALYDFVDDRGDVDEDVYAYSNGAGDERALVLFNNRFKTTRGRIGKSTHRGHVASELGVDPERGEWLVLRDVTHGLEYLRPARSIVDGGLNWELSPFEVRVLTGFRAVTERLERPYARLAAELAGRGTFDVERAARELYLRPVHAPLREACSRGHLEYLASQWGEPDASKGRAALEERLGHVADGLEWLLSQRVRRDVLVNRDAIRAAGERFERLHESARGDATSGASVLHADLLLATLELEAVLDLLGASDVQRLLRETKPEAVAEEARSNAVEATSESEPSLQDEGSVPSASSTEVAPLKEGEAPPSGASSAEAAPLKEGEAPPSGASSAEAAPLKEGEAPPSGASSAEVAPLKEGEAPPSGASSAGGASPEEASLSGHVASPKAAPQVVVRSRPREGAREDVSLTSRDVEDGGASMLRREALLSEWDLAAPVVAGFATAFDEFEARRRAALVLLVATLPFGVSPRASMRLALSEARGQAFMNVHEAGGTVWLNKERFEELARLLSEREFAWGGGLAASMDAVVDELGKLAHREGYRADRISAALACSDEEAMP